MLLLALSPRLPTIALPATLRRNIQQTLLAPAKGSLDKFQKSDVPFRSLLRPLIRAPHFPTRAASPKAPLHFRFL